MTDGEQTTGGQSLGGADIAAEARKLVDSVQEWARRTLPAPPSGHPGPECQWCPLCQAASVLRGEHPELTERVTELGTVVLGTLRSVFENATAHAGAAAPDDATPPGPPVQHIRLDGAEQ
ncbi:MAG TPA: hypothetical protein VFU35_15820 [Jatrophihabitans sp.]|nr:hypothetical protein [Jatrophihabitans sp.]